MGKILRLLLLLLVAGTSNGQSPITLSGTVLEAGTGMAIPKASLHLTNSGANSLSDRRGRFQMSGISSDTLLVTCIGYAPAKLLLSAERRQNLTIQLHDTVSTLNAAVVSVARKPGRTFMEEVISRKTSNDPERAGAIKYQRYTRQELDLDHLNFQIRTHGGFRSLALRAYSAIDSTAAREKELPIYFSERLADHFHSRHPRIDQEHLLATKSLGMKTDKLLSRLDKFHFYFNIYDDWLPVFDKTYVSPLNSHAFAYYKFYEGVRMADGDDSLQQVRFAPLRGYERAFSGVLWINTRTFAVESVDMELNRTANLNYIHTINYSETYKSFEDVHKGLTYYMPATYSSEVHFQSGPDLIGIPFREKAHSLKLVLRDKTVISQLHLQREDSIVAFESMLRQETDNPPVSDQAYWQTHRPDSLTPHEKNIYRLADTLNANRRFSRNIRLLNFAASGYWDFGNILRVGPYSSFISFNPLEGWRMRMSWWTLPGVSRKLNFFGYGAWGTLDHHWRGAAGLKYVWDDQRWTKTTLSYSNDYDLMTTQDDELDDDNIFSSTFRKNIPYSRILIRQWDLKHEQYLTPNWTATSDIHFKLLQPSFHFSYRPINPALDKPYDSVFSSTLPVAEASWGVRYARQERTTVLNYDKIHIITYHPVFTANYTYGFESGKALFEYHKVKLGLEQHLRLPPKSLLYYKLEAGKVFGTLPWLLLNIPAGNEYYVASRYDFNTMAPYEFSADQFLSLHTRFYLGGALLDKIPLIRKMGWRERISFNSYWGSLNQANQAYNGPQVMAPSGKPFMEAGVGVENIFHVLSVEYFRRLNYLDHPGAIKDGLFMGFTLKF